MEYGNSVSCMVRFNLKYYLIVLSFSKNILYMIFIKFDFFGWFYKGREDEEKVKIIRVNY